MSAPPQSPRGRKTMKLMGLVLMALAVLALSNNAEAHGMRTAYLELSEQRPGVALASWRTTVIDNAVTPLAPAGCKIAQRQRPSKHKALFTLKCEGGLAGKRLDIEGLGPVLTEAIVRIERADGSASSTVLTADNASWTIPGSAPPSALSVAAAYVGLGMRHIAAGADHLLFLLALVLLLRRPKAVLLAETAFTVSHSVSYSATALGWLQVSSAAAEACIALSLVLVALDLLRADRDKLGLRQAVALAFVFGLVHGLGFAGSLTEVGLPQQSAGVALLGFGVGVELGQVAFLLVVLGLMALIAKTRFRQPLVVAASTATGGIGAYWLITRTLRCLQHTIG